MNTPTTAPKQGFALVIALSLMAFVLLLLLSISTLVQVEASVSRLNQEQLAARQNALLALNLAIGQLQKYAGPDKRSTASAQLLNADNPKYIGIWPSDRTTSIGGDLADGEAVWMVSNASKVTPTATLTNPITLRKYKKSGDPDFSEVQAGIMPFASNDEGSSGGYAWWVDDESLKASLFPANAVSSVQETTDSSNAIYQEITSKNLEMVNTSRRFGVFPGSSPQVVSSDWDNFDYSDLDDRNYSFLTSLEGVSHVKGSQGSGASIITEDKLFHYVFDFTISNKGVLANAWNGGLRKDLTRGLDDQYEDKLQSEMIFQDTASDGSDIYGDLWKFFRDFYQTYKATDSYQFNGRTIQYTNFSDVNDLSSSFVSRGTNRYRYHASALDWIPYKDSYPSGDAYPSFYTSNMRPTMLRLRIGLGFSTVETAAGTGQYQLQLHLYPSVTLWNPFNFPIDLSKCYSNTGAITSLVENDIIWYYRGLELDINGVVSKGGNALDPDYFQAKMPTSGVINPGEIKVFALNTTGLNSGNRADLVDAIDPAVTADQNVWQVMSANYVFSAATQLTLNGVSSGVMNSSWSYIEPRLLAPQGGARSGMSNGERNYTSEPSRFDDTGLTRPYIIAANASDLAGERQPPQVAVFELGAPLMNGTERMSIFSQLNPLGYKTTSFIRGARPSDLLYNNRAFSGTTDPLTGQNNEEIHIDPITGNGFYGSTNLSGAGGRTQIVLYDVPRHPLTSLAEFMHANSSHFRETATYQVASSFPCIGMTDLSQTFLSTVLSNAEYSGIDLPYYMNRALFDDYFFSTIPSSDASDVYPYHVDFGDTTAANDYIDSRGALSNPRLVYYKKPSIVELRDSSDAYEAAASHLLIDGAFNINSTSENAWAAVLAGFRSMEINGASSFSNDDESPFLRHFIPRSDASNPYTGYASLTDVDIRALAKSIVEGIRERRASSPYGRLADFINRDPTAASDDAEMGLLDEAIRSADVNNHLTDGSNPTDLIKGTNNAGSRTFHQEVQPYNTAVGLPGWLTQQDILRPLAPIMTTRGDTFRVRTYGEYRNQVTGEVESKKWIEAIVQRVPDYVDESDLAWTDPSNINAVNQRFGRKFKITSFKWLNEDEL